MNIFYKKLWENPAEKAGIFSGLNSRVRPLFDVITKPEKNTKINAKALAKICRVPSFNSG